MMQPSYDQLKRRISLLEKEIKRQKDLKEALLESENIYKTISERSLAGIYVVVDGKFQSLNANAASYAGYRPEELIGKKSDSIVHPDDRTKVKRNAREMLCGKRSSPHEFRIVTKKKEIRWILETVTSIAYKGKRAILGNSMDITEHKRAEERLKESENLYRTIFETTRSATMILEEDMTISLLNTEFEKLTGYRKDDWEGRKKWTEFVVKEDLSKMKRYHRMRRVDPGIPPRNYEFSLIDSKGRIRNIFLTVDMIPGTKKSVASFMDITERKEAERKMKESENLYRAIFETTGSATIIIEEDMTISLINSVFEKFSGYSKAEWEGRKKWTEFVFPEDVVRMKRYHRMRRKDPDAAPKNYEFRFVDKLGRNRDVFLTVDMIPGTGKSVASMMDITERKRAEEGLRRRESELKIKSKNLLELNTALRVLLKQREDDKKELEEKVLSNIKELALPYIEKIKKGSMNSRDSAYICILESNLKDIISPFSYKLSSRFQSLTPKEIQVANFIKEGRTSKEIAEIMGVTRSAIDIHRYRVRGKLGLNNKKANLNSYLATMS